MEKTMPSPLFPSRQIGDYTITAISDGYLTASLDVLSNIDPADALRMQEAAGVTAPTSMHINCYQVRGAGRTILIDAGAGGFKQWGGRLSANLPLAGVDPSEIGTILLTHAHPDHVGGLLDADGGLVYPNAELVAHHREVAFWQDDANLDRASDRTRGNFLMARRVFDQYRAKLRVFDGGEVLPGIIAMPLPGHTDGHTGYLFGSGREGLLVWGDVVHFPHIQTARPEVSIVFDQDPVLAASTRKKLLDRVSSDGCLVGGIHLGDRGFARVEEMHGGHRVLYEACEAAAPVPPARHRQSSV